MSNANNKRVVIDPVTRIEGHLRIELDLDSNNTVSNALSIGTMWRGIEPIVLGRDPRDVWAFVQRICGVCTGAHALASVRSVEDALGITVPENANIIRNILNLTLFVHDHLVHFYHLHALDWVDVVSAAKASPKATSDLAGSVSSWAKSSPGYFTDIRNQIQRTLNSGQLGPFRNGYWGHPAYKLSPEANLMGVAHYLEALAFQRELVKIHAVFGGKNPHPMWLVGGAPSAINVHGTGSTGAINIERLAWVKTIAQQTLDFVSKVYVPDLITIGSQYKEWFKIGGGLASQNILCYGDFPILSGDQSNKNLRMPRGAIINGKFNEIHEVDLRDPTHIQEFVNHSWYRYPDQSKGLHPWDGATELNFQPGEGTKKTGDRFDSFDETGKYSYIKAPRWKGHPMEMGPLARMILGYSMGKESFKAQLDPVLHKLELPFEAMFSTMGRTLARGLEAQWAAGFLLEEIHRLESNIRNGNLETADISKWKPSTWPSECKGVGYCEAPRGSLAHWIKVADGKVANYQCVVPTTWNGGPRDADGKQGPYEVSLTNLKLAQPSKPLEVLRVVHSFDPCLACATHIMDENGEEMAQITVQGATG